jgi:hypothetical protein
MLCRFPVRTGIHRESVGLAPGSRGYPTHSIRSCAIMPIALWSIMWQWYGKTPR